MNIFVGILLVLLILGILVYAFMCIMLRDKGMCTDNPDLQGHVYVITGTTHGLGREAAFRFAKHGATVVMLNRSDNTGKATAESIIKETGNEHVYNIHCDLADLESVCTASKEVLSKWPEIDVLLCNAGIITPVLSPTAQGFEPHYGINFLSHFVLVNNLLPALQRRPQARLVLMSSVGQWGCLGLDFNHLTAEDYKGRFYDSFISYCRSKLAMLIFAKECQRRFGCDSLVSVAAAPGVVLTDLWREISPLADFFMRVIVRPMTKTVLEGAQSEIACSIMPYENLVPGAYYDHRKPAITHPQANNKEVGKKLWETALQQTSSFLLNPQIADPDHTQ